MADQHLLSDLCSICHVHPPKYKCPRCSTRTCSLECVKRHKKRAGCSGQRDPTGFVKKTQLYTAAGVDHDFNFIMGIEQKANDAERLVNEATTDPWHNPKRQYALNSALRRTGVRVEKAPRGLSRQLQNRTRWAHNSNSIMWTVEWIDSDQNKRLDDVSERTALCDAHEWHMRRVRGEMSAGQRRNKRRKLASEKRDAALEDGPITQSIEGDFTNQQPDPETKNINEKTQQGAETSLIGLLSQDNVKNAAGASEDTMAMEADSAAPISPKFTSKSEPNPCANPVTELEPDTKQYKSLERNANSKPDVEADASSNPASTDQPPTAETTSPRADPAPPASLPPGAPDKAGNHFYLVKPRTPIASTVLIPLSPTAPLSHSLRGRTLIEFPSIQVLAQPPTALPEGFVLETEYGDVVGRQEDELRRAAGEGVGLQGKTAAGCEDAGEGRQRVPNSSDIMAILQRDILS